MNIFGASGHAKVVIDIVKSIKEEIDNVIDDNRAITAILGHPVVHDISTDIVREKIIVAVGDNRTRKNITARFADNIHSAIIHSSAVVSKTVEMGIGTVIMANVTINSDSFIGENCIINSGAIVEHDCVIQNFVHISPNSTMAGGVFVGEGTHVGIGAMVIPGIKIGSWCTIGAGAVVIEDIPDYATVVGNPGRVIKVGKSENEQK